VSATTLTVAPDVGLGARRTYTLVLDGLRTTGGRTLADVRLGFRTAG
jgi:hypothetical protein